MKTPRGVAGAMRLPLAGRLLDGLSEEWREVPVYTAIKHLAGRPVGEVFDVHPEGLDHLPDDEGAVLASNHASWFDPIFLGVAVARPIRWMAKADLFRHPLSARFFEKAGQVKVDRVSGGNQAAVDRCVELVERDRLVGIFPEGTRSIDGSLRRGRTGVARVALRSGKPVVPVAMNSYDVLPKRATIPDLEQPLVVQVGEPLRVEASRKRLQDQETLREVTDEVMRRIGRQLERARTRREALALEDGG